MDKDDGNSSAQGEAQATGFLKDAIDAARQLQYVPLTPTAEERAAGSDFHSDGLSSLRAYHPSLDCQAWISAHVQAPSTEGPRSTARGFWRSQPCSCFTTNYNLSGRAALRGPMVHQKKKYP